MLYELIAVVRDQAKTPIRVLIRYTGPAREDQRSQGVLESLGQSMPPPSLTIKQDCEDGRQHCIVSQWSGTRSDELGYILAAETTPETSNAAPYRALLHHAL